MGLINSDVSVNAITGSTGAGQKPGATTHFSWRNNNMSIYKAFNHHEGVYSPRSKRLIDWRETPASLASSDWLSPTRALSSFNRFFKIMASAPL